MLLCHCPEVPQHPGSWARAKWIHFLPNFLDSICILQSTYKHYSSTTFEVLQKLITMILIYFCIYLKFHCSMKSTLVLQPCKWSIPLSSPSLNSPVCHYLPWAVSPKLDTGLQQASSYMLKRVNNHFPGVFAFLGCSPACNQNSSP